MSAMIRAMRAVSLVGAVLFLTLGAIILPAGPLLAQAAGGARAPASPKIENMYDLCRMRERVIIAHSKAIVTQTISYLDEREPRRKNDKRAAIDAEQVLLEQAELSWQRIGCVDLLYGEPGRAPR